MLLSFIIPMSKFSIQLTWKMENAQENSRSNWLSVTLILYIHTIHTLIDCYPFYFQQFLQQFIPQNTFAKGIARVSTGFQLAIDVLKVIFNNEV